MNVFDLVVGEVSFVDAIEALDVRIALVLEGSPVEGSCLLDRKPVGLGFVDGLGESSGIEGDLFGNAPVGSSLLA